MTKRKKFWLGFLTFLPLGTMGLYFLCFFYVWFQMFTGSGDLFQQGEPPPTAFYAGFAFLFLLILITVIVSIGLLIYYILHANKHFNTPNDNQKLIWILVLVLAGGIGNIAYFFAVILPIKIENDTELMKA